MRLPWGKGGLTIRPVRDAPAGAGRKAGRGPRETEGIAPMPAALAGYGAHVDEWAAGPVAFGCRRRPSEEGATRRSDAPCSFSTGERLRCAGLDAATNPLPTGCRRFRAWVPGAAGASALGSARRREGGRVSAPHLQLVGE